MEDYKLKDLHASLTLGWSWNWRPNQFRYWYPKLRAKPYLPKCKRESIIIGTTLDVAEEPQRLPRQGARRGVTRI
jgi:hypothetical protein